MPKHRKNRIAKQRERLDIQKNGDPQDREPYSKKTQEKRDLFETGLEALEVPLAAIRTSLTATATSLFQVMLLNMDRDTGKLGKRKVADYARMIARNEMSVYNALSELNEKKFIETTTSGWVRGTVLMRHRNKKKDDAQQEIEMPDIPLSRALVHRQALKIMIQDKLSSLTQRLYWEFATRIDIHTGQIAERQVEDLAKNFGVKKAAIYKSVRQLNAAGLTDFENDYGVTGHMPHVALSHGVIRFAVEHKIQEAIHGKTAAQIYEQYRVALYRAFGVPIERLKPAEIKKAIAALKNHLKPYAEPPNLKTDTVSDGNGIPYSDSPLNWAAVKSGT